MTPDRRLALLTSKQLGCATVEQSLAIGLTADQIEHRIRTGRLEWIGAHVLRIAGSPASWEQQLMAGLLDLGPEAVVSRRAAAALHAFEGFPRREVEFTVPRRRRNAGVGWRVHSTLCLDPIDRVSVGPFACTSASRTIIDLAWNTSRNELERAIECAIRDGLTSPAFLGRRLMLLRGPGRRGVRMLDELLVDSGGHSALERAFLTLVRRAGLPKPVCQRIYRRDGKTVARVDFSFEPCPVVVEVSGRRGHSTDSERAKDARRRNELQTLGLVVLEFTYEDVLRRPTYVIDVLSRHLP
jgi:very-short-patch-repair endonuclease